MRYVACLLAICFICFLVQGCTNGLLSTTSSGSIVSFSFGNAHSYNGSSAYDSVTSSVPTISVPFTVDFFFRANTLGSNQYLFGITPVNATYVYLNTSGGFNFAAPGSACSSLTNTTTPGLISVGTVYHFAYVIDASGVAKIYLNGSPLAATISLVNSCSSTGFAIGSAVGGGLYFNGVIDEFRISNTDRSIGGGSSFPVPTTPYVSDGNTILLLHMNSLSTVDYTSIGSTLNSISGSVVTSFLP